MSSENDMLGLLGLCLRAGKLVCGDDAVADAIAAGDARLLLLAADAGAGIRKRTERHAASGVPVICLTDDAAQLGWALGRRVTAVCCITDIGFAAAAARKAADADPQYTELAQRLDEKKERIQSRRGKKKPRKRPAGSRTSGGMNHSNYTKRGGERA